MQKGRKNTTIKDLPLQPGGKPERRRRKEEREGERGRRDWEGTGKRKGPQRMKG